MLQGGLSVARRPQLHPGILCLQPSSLHSFSHSFPSSPQAQGGNAPWCCERSLHCFPKPLIAVFSLASILSRIAETSGACLGPNRSGNPLPELDHSLHCYRAERAADGSANAWLLHQLLEKLAVRKQCVHTAVVENVCLELGIWILRRDFGWVISSAKWA